MAITLTSQLTDESLDPGSPNQFGTANAQASETVIHLEGTNCSAMGHSGTVGTATPVTADSQAANSNFRGMYVATNIARDHNHLHVWMRDLYPIRNKSIGGVSIYIANGTTGEALYYMTGIDDGYGGGWYHAVINLSTTDRTAADLGTLPTGNVDRVGYAGNISASKGESFLQNSYLDAIRYGADGIGITFTGGTSGVRETMVACADADTISAGLLRNIGGSLFCDGCLTFGAATLTTYIQDSLGSINFTDFSNGPGTTPVVAADYYRIVLADGTTGVTNLDLTDYVWNGVSRALPFRFTANLGTGDAYDSLRGQYIFGEIVTLNTLCSSDSDSFIECDTIIPGGIELTDPSFSNCDALTLTATNDLISGGATVLHNTLTNIPFITTNSLNKIENHSFDNTAGVGHAMEITVAGTYDSDNIQYVGYAAQGGTAGNRAIYNNSAGLITINVINGGNTPSYRNGTSASTVVNNAVTISTGGLTEGAAVKVIANETIGTITVGDVLDEQLADSLGVASFSLDYEGAFDPSGLDVIVRARQQGLPNFALHEDNAVFTDQTTAANSSTTDDMTLIVASPVAGQDWYYFGHAEQFTQIKLDISTAGTGGFLLDFEYWNGATWANMSGVVDGTNAYTNTGENIISWNLPGSWATTSVDTKGPVYYIRIGYLSGTLTVAPLGRKCKLDVTRYLPFVQNRTITSTGLTVFASWTVDSIALF